MRTKLQKKAGMQIRTGFKFIVNNEFTYMGCNLLRIIIYL